MSVGANISPKAVVAGSYQQLERKMALISANRGTYVKFHSITHINNEKWIAWYDTEHKLNLKKEFRDGISKE